MIMPALAKKKVTDPASIGLRKTATNDIYHPMTVNNIFNYYSNNGDGSFNNFSSTAEGFEFPKGLDKATVIFEDGVVWGCKQNGTLKVGGSTYWHGLQAGPIITNGTATTDPVADDPGSSSNRLFRVRPELKPIPGVTDPEDPAAAGELAAVQNSEVALIGRYEVGIKAKDILAQYWRDWNEWPATKGAPYTDVNNNGQYDPTVDIPGVPQADQTMWYVSNDLDAAKVNTLSGSTPIGIEMQKTIWAYNLNGALANTIFASTKIINKSGIQLDSMFVAQWTDPDLGDAADDFVGCDRTRSLGYVYNGKAHDANFDLYNLVVPAAGFDFFQGPMVPGAPTDTAIFDLKYRFGYKNLPMTSFNFFINSNNTYADPPNASYDGTTQWYRLLTGLVGTSGAQYTNPITNTTTTFVLDGDPVAGTGWIDGTIAGPGDRRMALCSGPFSMVPGVSDTQEVVVANIAGRGADYLSSITILKAADDFTQSIYNRLFSFPQPPARPKLDIVYLDGKVVLSWGDPESAAKTEGQLNDQGYTFEGYNVWQLPKNSADGAKLLATFDRSDDTVKIIHDNVYDAVLGEKILKPVQFGTNSGLVHTFEVDKDAINGGEFINYRNYYFAVTAYNFNPAPTLLGTSLENAINAQSVIPKPVSPGIAYAKKYGDTISVTHTSGVSDAVVLATVVDVNALTGDTYRVTYDSLKFWYLIDVTKNDTLIRKTASSKAGAQNGYTVDGMSITVYGPALGFKDFLVVNNAGGPVTPPSYATFAFNGAGFPNGSDAPGGDRPASNEQTNGFSGWGIQTGVNGSGLFDYPFFLSRTIRNDDAIRFTPYDFEIRFNSSGSLAYNFLSDGAIYHVPFELWNIGINTPNDTSDDFKMMALMNDVNGNDAFDLDSVDSPVSGVDNDPETDWIYWYNPVNTGPGRVGYNAYATAFAAGDTTGALNAIGDEVMARMTLVGWNDGSVTDATWPNNVAAKLPENGTVFRMISNKPATSADVFTFVATAPVRDPALAKTDVAKINVFPNPYLGFNKLEPSNYVRFVTFTHLPQKATIRIYNLAGILVRTIVKNDKNQTITWDLQNVSGFPVASGMYIAYIDLPDVGSTKTLKLGVVQEQEFLHHF
jgi:hypothetical protein